MMKDESVCRCSGINGHCDCTPDSSVRLLAERDALRQTASKALAAMVRVTAPDNAFTDAVDALDAALHNTSKL